MSGYNSRMACVTRAEEETKAVFAGRAFAALRRNVREEESNARRTERAMERVGM